MHGHFDFVVITAAAAAIVVVVVVVATIRSVRAHTVILAVHVQFYTVCIYRNTLAHNIQSQAIV